jgi:hypothetical protein
MILNSIDNKNVSIVNCQFTVELTDFADNPQKR